MKMRELCERTGMSKRNVHYYIKEGLLSPRQDQVNGYYDYLATPRSLTLGGYTYWSSFVSRGAIPKLKRELYPLLRSFMK